MYVHICTTKLTLQNIIKLQLLGTNGKKIDRISTFLSKCKNAPLYHSYFLKYSSNCKIIYFINFQSNSFWKMYEESRLFVVNVGILGRLKFSICLIIRGIISFCLFFFFWNYWNASSSKPEDELFDKYVVGRRFSSFTRNVTRCWGHADHDRCLTFDPHRWETIVGA